MNIKSFFALFTALCLMLCLCGCQKNNPGDQKQSDTVSDGQTDGILQLLYCGNDTFNPYTLTTKVNAELCLLLFDPLIKIDNSFEPIYTLADHAKQDGNDWEIILKNASFTDGTAFRGDDVVYSYNLAKTCERYKNQLSRVSSVENTESTVTFHLSVNDPYFINVLDFPILKSGSDNRENEDSVILPPIGTGRFVLNDDENGLVRNDRYFGTVGHISAIKLIDAPDSESVAHYVEVGASDFYYADRTDSNITRMSGQKMRLHRNNLIYIGINGSDTLLSSSYLRYAISAAIDREKLILSACYGNAVAATGPFHPAWKEIGSYQTIQTSAKKEIAIENLSKIGYNNLDTNGYRVNASGFVLSLSLLINADNATRVNMANILVAQFKAVGIRLSVKALPYADYLDALNGGQFQLYLAEAELGNNFNIEPLTIPGGSCAFGVTENSDGESKSVMLSDIINRYQSGEVKITDVITAVQSEMPFIPLCYRDSVLFYSDSVGNLSAASANDIFLSINELTQNNQ